MTELRGYIRKELLWWKWIVGVGVLLVVFFADIVSREMFYSNELTETKNKVETLTEIVETLSYNVTILCLKNGIEPKKNPLKGKFQ